MTDLDVIKNQIVPKTTQTFLHLRRVAMITIIINPEKIMVGSLTAELKGNPISTFKLKGK